MRIIDIKQGTDEWLNLRKNQANASETPALFEANPWKPKNAIELAHLKYGNLKIFYNQAMRDGNKYEPAIRNFVNFTYNYNFIPAVAQWDENHKFQASFDGLDLNEKIILEIKNSKHTYDYVEKTGEAPKNYYLQVQHQLLVSGFDKCVFAVRNSAISGIKVIEIEADTKIKKEIVEKWLAFFEKYEGKELPPLQKIDTDKNKIEFASQYASLDKKIKELQKEQKKIKAILLDGVDDTTKIGNILISKNTRKTINYKEFLNDQELEISDDYIKESTSFRITIKKGEK